MDVSGATVFAPVAPVGGDQSTALQTLLDSGAKVVDLGPAGRVVRASVRVPSGVTLMSSGAVLNPSSGMAYGVSTSGEGAAVVGVPIDSTYDSNMTGGEGSVRVDHSNTTVLDCTFYGIGYRHGVTFVEQATLLRNVTIDGCTMHDVGFGILKNNTPTDRLAIAGCNIYDVARGDGIELNVGGDTNCLILNNTITGVRSGGYTNTGIGIGIAGNGTYGIAQESMARAVTISGNTVSDVDLEGIHLEVMYGCVIADNTVTVGGTTRAGIVLYGSVANTVVRNDVSGSDIGIWDLMGNNGVEYVVSSTRNSVIANAVTGCRVGVQSLVAGEGTGYLASGNYVRDCQTGISHVGPCSVTMEDNEVHDATSPYVVDLMDTGIPDTQKSLVFNRNVAFAGGQAVANSLTYQS